MADKQAPPNEESPKASSTTHDDLIEDTLLTQLEELATKLDQDELLLGRLDEDIKSLDEDIQELNKTMNQQVESLFRLESLTKSITVLTIWVVIVSMKALLLSAESANPKAVPTASWILDLLLLVAGVIGSVYAIFRGRQGKSDVEGGGSKTSSAERSGGTLVKVTRFYGR